MSPPGMFVMVGEVVFSPSIFSVGWTAICDSRTTFLQEVSKTSELETACVVCWTIRNVSSFLGGDQKIS